MSICLKDAEAILDYGTANERSRLARQLLDEIKMLQNEKSLLEASLRSCYNSSAGALSLRTSENQR